RRKVCRRMRTSLEQLFLTMTRISYTNIVDERETARDRSSSSVCRQAILPYLLRHRATRNSAYQLSSPRRRGPITPDISLAHRRGTSRGHGVSLPACAGTTVEWLGTVLHGT